MNYPLISEYVEAIKAAEDNFEELSYLRPVMDDNGLPVMTSGNFAVVFKMKDERDEKYFAVKCFTKEQEGREEAYHQITEELKNVSSPYLTSVRYLDKELFVDTDQTNETVFPVLLMDWVEGKTLDKYLRENLDDKFALEMLAYRFSQLTQWLIPQPFAHGDLKPDNILVREDGTLVLVDYDGMYVPAMKGQKARELGSPDFRHPQRTENDFDEHIDDFSLVSILLSLKSISLKYGLFDDYCTTDHLLFSEYDYRNINDSDVFKVLMSFSDIEINKLIVAFLHYVVNSAKSQYPIIASLNSNYSPEKTKKYRDRYYSLSNKYVDKFGVEYTPDKKILLRWGNISKEETGFPTFYRVLEGTEVICDEAFMFCKNLTSIYLPKSLKQIGKSVFVGTRLSSIECNSSMFDVDDNILFSYDRRVLYYYPKNKKDTYFDVPEQVKLIVPGCFSTAEYLWVIKLKHIQYNFDDLALIGIYISVPMGTKKYLSIEDHNKSSDNKYLDVETRNNIFEGDIVVDDGVVYSSDKTILYRFPYWSDKEEYRVNENCKIIEEAAFDDNIGYDEEWGSHIGFNKLKTIYLPNGLEEIKDYAFVGCGHVENMTIPLSVKKIGNYVFGQCVNLTTLTFLSRIETVGEKAFDIGKTMPAPLVNPYVPHVELSHGKKCVDIIICPKGTEDYFKVVLGNDNSWIYTLDKNEKQIELEAPNYLHDIDYFVSDKYLSLVTNSQLREILKDAVCTKYYGMAGEGIGVDLSKLKKILGGLVFDVYKPTNRYYYSHYLSGICYVTKNYRARFISEDDSFSSINDAIDFLCRVYFDVYDNILFQDVNSEDNKVISLTSYSEDELKDSIKDETNLVIYDNSGQKLLNAYDYFVYHIDDCHIRRGCKVICDFAFCNCAAGPPNRIWLPDSIISIGKDAFTTNSSPTISEIIIPDGQKERFANMIPQYSHLLIEESLITDGTNSRFERGVEDEQGCIYSSDGRHLLSCKNSWEKEEIIIKKGTVVICDKVFEDRAILYQNMSIDVRPSLLTHVEIPNTVQYIGLSAFYGCYSLKEISIPYSVLRISSGAFCSSGLLSVIIPRSVTFIAGFAFASCINLYKIEFLSSTTIIDEDAFIGCEAIRRIVVPTGAKKHYQKSFPHLSHLIFERINS